MDRNKFIQYLINRLKEKSTYIGIISILGALGITFKPELVGAIAPAGIALAALLSALLPADMKK